jgi:hypothetical protein
LAIYNYTRQELRHLTATLCDDLITGVVASPASGTFVCTSTDWVKPDDYFNTWIEMFCYDGTGVGTSGNPSDWDKDTYTLTFLPAATLTAGDLVEMHRRFTVSTYNHFINLAIEIVAKEALVDYVDTSLTLAASTYQYDLPTSLMYIYSIEMESSTADLYDASKPIDRSKWRIIPSSTTKLEFVKALWSPTVDRALRITGLASPSILDTDSEECPLNPTFISYQAAALLHQSRIRGSDVDSEYHSGQMTLCQQMADRVRTTMQTSTVGALPVVEY